MARHYPNGAFKLLGLLLYGSYSYVEVGQEGVLRLRSVYKLARLLGTDSRGVKKWLQYLEDSGYISFLTLSEDRRQAQFKIRKPVNVR